MSGTVIVLTGASGGIGAATAEALARRGARLVLVGRRQDALDQLAGRCGPDTLVVAADVTRRDDAARIVREALARFGHIDVWINNAGQGISRMPSELTDEDIDLMMQVNVKSALYGIQEVLPHFKARGTGHIINISSMLGRISFTPVRSAYSGAKSFLNALTAALRTELATEYPGIHVSLVSPGVVATDFGLKARHGGPDSRQLPGAQSAEEVAEVIAGVIDTRHPDVYTRPDGGDMVARHYAVKTEE